MQQWTGSKLGLEYVKSVYYHAVYLGYILSTSWEMPGWMKQKLESRLSGEISITTIMQITRRLHHPYDRRWRGTKELIDEGEEEEWNSWVKTQDSKTKIMASGPITSWQIDGETVETLTKFIFLSSKITADGDCSHEIKRHSLEKKLRQT